MLYAYVHSLHDEEKNRCRWKLKYSSSIYTSDRERERARLGTELLSLSHISPTLQHTHTSQVVAKQQ